MTRWRLNFDGGTKPLDLAVFEAPIEKLIGAVKRIEHDWVGDPREPRFRDVEVSAAANGLSLAVTISETEGWGEAPACRFGDLYLDGPFDGKLAVWTMLRETLAPFGYTDHTLTWAAFLIVDEADELGRHDVADKLKRDITAELIAKGPYEHSLQLNGMRADFETVLAACPEPASITQIQLAACKLSAAPANLARFINCAELYINDNPLAQLDPSVMPKLTSVCISNTQLDATALRAKYPAIAWKTD